MNDHHFRCTVTEANSLVVRDTLNELILNPNACYSRCSSKMHITNYARLLSFEYFHRIVNFPLTHTVIVTLNCNYSVNLINFHRSRSSVVGIATGYGLDDRGVGVRVPVGSRIFSSPNRPDRLSGLPNLLSNGYRG
jgi:hypothetical protein